MSRMGTMAMAAALATTMSTGAMAQADNTNSKTTPALSGWMTDYSRTNNGRISRDAYMREQQRRWDLADRQKRGLTVDEINQAYGYTWSTPTPMGTSATPGDMGPKDVKK